MREAQPFLPPAFGFSAALAALADGILNTRAVDRQVADLNHPKARPDCDRLAWLQRAADRIRG